MSRLIAKGDVTYALGFTPYDAANPAAYQTATQVWAVATGQNYATTSAVQAAIAAAIPSAPLLARVATTGSYLDLNGRPDLSAVTSPAGFTAFFLAWFAALPTVPPAALGLPWNDGGILVVTS